MSKYYNPNKSKSYLFNPAQKEPYRLSRSKIDMYLECPRCFYMDQRLGVGRVPGFPFSLNSAVDKLLKKEFDAHRAKGSPHPLMKAYGLDAVPYKHEKLEEWRDSLRRGIAFHHEPSNFFVRGGIDDVWVSPEGELIIVDYKATSKDGEVSLDAEWQDGYKRQMEVYQWLFKQNGFSVSPTGYFVYCNGNTDREAFDARLEFEIKLIPYTGDDSWIPNALMGARACLMADEIPAAAEDCDHCKYREAAAKVENCAPKGKLF
ncbi:MAG: PD-(D/E)XK nuclease family protein [Candidatus Liptonbacteria bacterium]